MKRPISLTIVAWFLIASNAIALLFVPFSLRNLGSQALLSHYLLPVWATLGMSTIVEIVNIIIGIAILKGREWSRKAYIAVFVLGLAVTLINSQFKMLLILIPGILLFALCVYLLYRRPATEYFRQGRA